MWFKNLCVFRMLSPIAATAEEFKAALTAHALQPCGELEMEHQGWVPPRENGDLVHVVNRQLLFALGSEKKLLPEKVIQQYVKVRAAELADQQGFAPGRKQLKEIKEQVTDQLLPRAFSLQSKTLVWLDPVNGWLVVDTGNASKAEDVFKMLLKSFDKLPFGALRTERSPLAAMTDWLAADEAPAGFTVDQDAELRATGEGKATVRYVRHTLEVDDLSRHISAGKQCTRLAMTWSDRISFVLTEDLVIKRLAPLDVLKEPADGDSKNEDERFDADFALMTGEVAKLLSDVVAALGGVEQEKEANSPNSPSAKGSVDSSVKVPEMAE